MTSLETPSDTCLLLAVCRLRQRTTRRAESTHHNIPAARNTRYPKRNAGMLGVVFTPAVPSLFASPMETCMQETLGMSSGNGGSVDQSRANRGSNLVTSSHLTSKHVDVYPNRGPTAGRCRFFKLRTTQIHKLKTCICGRPPYVYTSQKGYLPPPKSTARSVTSRGASPLSPLFPSPLSIRPAKHHTSPSHGSLAG